VLPAATAQQQRILDRIALQRERLRARRAARAQAQALAESRRAASGGPEDSLALRAAGFAREHPLAVAAIAGVAVVAGPRRLIRWAGVLLPMLLRLRR
jgi:hypothetical protein